ncbi:MAG: methyltransferase domain-containing protein [Candidatus Shapirobacteria bacterium]
MINRLLEFIICPECQHNSLLLSPSKTDGIIQLPTQKNYLPTDYFTYRDIPNQFLILNWQPNESWLVWPENPDYIVNINSLKPLTGVITSSKTGIFNLHLQGIVSNQQNVYINNKKITKLTSLNNNLLDYIFLGQVSLNKGDNTIRLVTNGFSSPDYLQRDLIHQNLQAYNKLINPPITDSLNFENVIEGLITCHKCHNSYPIIEGIPILLKSYLLQTYINSGKIPSRLLPKLTKNPSLLPKDPGVNYKISEISIDQTQNLSPSFFESMINHPFIAQDAQRTQEKLLSFSLLTFLLQPKSNEILFDNAAGSGWTSYFLSRLGCEVISADINFDYVKVGRQHTQKTFFHQIVCDSENIPIKSNIVDSVFSYDSFHHMPNKHLCLQNFSSILKAGGRAVFYEPASIHNTNYYSQMVMDKYSILEQGFSQDDFSNYLIGLKFKPPLFHVNPYFKDANVIILDKFGYRNVTSLTPGILKATYVLIKIERKSSTITLQLNLTNSGNTVWLGSNQENVCGCVYLKIKGYTSRQTIHFEKNICLKKNILPSTSLIKSIILDKTLIKDVEQIEIDCFVHSLIEFKHAHASGPLVIKLPNETIHKTHSQNF